MAAQVIADAAAKQAIQMFHSGLFTGFYLGNENAPFIPRTT
jgi:hypothetical protein